jgi:hypothetical protein
MYDDGKNNNFIERRSQKSATVYQGNNKLNLDIKNVLNNKKQKYYVYESNLSSESSLSSGSEEGDVDLIKNYKKKNEQIYRNKPKSRDSTHNNLDEKEEIKKEKATQIEVKLYKGDNQNENLSHIKSKKDKKDTEPKKRKSFQNQTLTQKNETEKTNTNKTLTNETTKSKLINNEPQIHSLNKIYISIDGLNNIAITPNIKTNTKFEKKIIKNVKDMINKKRKDLSNGFPKIVTNNGERIITSSKPIYNAYKFSTYNNPNVIALNYSIQKVVGNKLQKSLKKKENFYDKNDKLLSDKRNTTETSSKGVQNIKYNNLYNNNFLI